MDILFILIVIIGALHRIAFTIALLSEEHSTTKSKALKFYLIPFYWIIYYFNLINWDE